ncbi:MAG: hypothetical protein ABIE68_02455 [bacterium]
MEIWLLGNKDLAIDNLPLKLKKKLQKEFPEFEFFEISYIENEESIPRPLVIIDTVQGIDKVKLFRDIKEFRKNPSITMHDLDVHSQLLFLDKLKKLPSHILIFGLPQNSEADEVLPDLIFSLRSNLPSKNVTRNSYKDHKPE